MFARLTGLVDELHDNQVVLDVNGVGYLVACSRRTLARLTRGESARLYIETQVREDAINLYGFIDTEEQAWFKLLTTVQGVGAKVGMTILSTLQPNEMALALAAQDKAMFTRADGVGPKLATRIVTELKDKLPESMMGAGGLKAVKPGARNVINVVPAGPSEPSMDGDAISALVNLGYTRAEAFAAVMKVKVAHNNLNVGEMVRLSLLEINRSAA